MRREIIACLEAIRKGLAVRAISDSPALDANWDESAHPRGNPKNAGQFAKKGSATGKTVASSGVGEGRKDAHSEESSTRPEAAHPTSQPPQTPTDHWADARNAVLGDGGPYGALLADALDAIRDGRASPEDFQSEIADILDILPQGHPIAWMLRPSRVLSSKKKPLSGVQVTTPPETASSDASLAESRGIERKSGIWIGETIDQIGYNCTANATAALFRSRGFDVEPEPRESGYTKGFWERFNRQRSAMAKRYHCVSGSSKAETLANIERLTKTAPDGTFIHMWDGCYVPHERMGFIYEGTGAGHATGAILFGGQWYIIDSLASKPVEKASPDDVASHIGIRVDENAIRNALADESSKMFARMKAIVERKATAEQLAAYDKDKALFRDAVEKTMRNDHELMGSYVIYPTDPIDPSLLEDVDAVN